VFALWTGLRLAERCIGLDLGAIERHMPQLYEASLFAQMQDWPEQFTKRLQVPLAESEMVRKSGASSPTILMKSTRSRHALAIRRRE
jgi:hypothetical protein